MNVPLIIATRGSDLALWQANYIKSLLEENGLSCGLKIIKTKGDEIQHLSLEKIEGKGFFTAEIESALLYNEADIAVHSHKDLPTESHPDLIIAAVSDREDPSELLLIRKEAVDLKRKFFLKTHASVGTSSSRRKSQLLSFRKDIKLKDLRGNIPTRVQKLRDGLYDAILIAAAGVDRLQCDVNDFHIERISPKEFIPAPAQGVLAVQIRKKDRELFEKLQVINNPETAKLISIERTILNLFHGGCHAPVGAYAEYDEDVEMFKVRACKADSWDDAPISVYFESKRPESLAEKAVSKITNVKPASVLITRHLKAGDYFLNVLTAKGFKVTGHAFIEMVPVPMNYFPVTDWIFFSSKHAVKYFFQQKPELGNQKLACIGKSTADTVRKFGRRAEFIGYSTDTKLTGKQFAAQVGNGTVLFPQAKESLRSVQNGFVKQEQVTDVVVYETVRTNPEPGFQMTDFEIIIFTSPSNVESFFSGNKIEPGQRILAMGEATGSALRKYRITNYSLPDSFDDTGLVRAVFSL